MDRFMMKLSMGLPTKEEELAILDRYMEKEPLSELEKAFTLEELLEVRKEAEKVFVHTCIREYMVDIVDATRKADGIIMGVSPRGSLALLRCVKAYAYLQGRDYVIPDDIKAVAVPVLAHRLVLSYGYDQNGDNAAKVIEGILEDTAVPTEDFTK